MLKDRAQKASALRFCVSKRWLPQLEVEVEPARRIEKSKFLLTDLDVLCVAPSAIGGHVRMVFDCKSGAKESAIGRAFWLHGVMVRVAATHGFVILNDKVTISRDHRISASDLAVSLFRENEFGDFAQSMGGSIGMTGSATENVDAWDQLAAVSGRYPTLAEYCTFGRSGYWMIKDHGEQCRKTVAKLRAIRAELDPIKKEHLAVFGDALCLFLLALSELANRLFLVLLRPTSREEFSSSLLALIYGGYENVEVAQRIRRLSSGSDSDGSVSIFPEIAAFEKIVREILQAPNQALTAALLARELCLSFLTGAGVTSLQRDLTHESPYASKFVFLASDYLQKAIRLPPEFGTVYADAALTQTPAVVPAPSLSGATSPLGS
jgi:hypothetical protein